ncbi:hypothetical protein AMELA_G00234170 [Ameiurus melas]|uniref:DUF4939 domain-containing protein n=1 Tax=Ameiurus melas TaxID=219545 RepID=A0A7J5ZXP9_AMEME|nr:hypothetical protein AMELA_G00234170 [Ameiurus melas]
MRPYRIGARSDCWPLYSSMQFPQRYDIELPLETAGLGSYPLEFLLSCQVYFCSLAHPKPSQRQWIGFLVSRFYGPASDWVEQLVSTGSLALHDVTEFARVYFSWISSRNPDSFVDLTYWGGELMDSPSRTHHSTFIMRR